MNQLHHRVRTARAVGFSLCCLLGTTPAQCDLQAVGIPSAFNGGIAAITSLPHGDVFVAGYFLSAGPIAAGGMARFDGSTWSAMGQGLAGAPLWPTFPTVSHGFALTTLPTGDVVVGGPFATAGGVLANGLARWRNNTWSAFGSGANRAVHALGVLPNGDLVAAGDFTLIDGVAANGIARWNGSSWTSLGAGLIGSASRVQAMVIQPDGGIVVAGPFFTAGGAPAPNVARWDGSNWSTMGGINMVGSASYALAAAPSGDVFVAGGMTLNGSVHIIARWDGSSWHSLATMLPSVPSALSVLPNGDLLAQTAAGLSRWRNGVWSVAVDVSGGVLALHATDDGQLFVGGNISSLAGQPQLYFGSVETPCKPAVAPVGPGCNWSSGLSALQPQGPAWAGSDFRGEVTGMPPVAVAASVYGLSPAATPLANLLPLAGASCVSATDASLVELAVPTAGMLDTQLALPNSPTLAGLHFYHQVIVLELNTSGQWISTSASNALDLTIGFF